MSNATPSLAPTSSTPSGLKVTPPAPPPTPRNTTSGYAIFGNLAIAALLFGVLELIAFQSNGNVATAWRYHFQNLIVTLAALFPYLLYSFFITSRRTILERDFRLSLQRLGLNSEDESFTARFDAVFGAQNNLNQFVRLPLLVVTLVLITGWFFVFYPFDHPEIGWPWPNRNPFVMSFLGAYLLSLMTLYYRYLTNDLKPQLFVGISVRILTVFIVNWGLLLLPTLTATGGGDQPAPIASDEWTVLLLSFVAGIFPTAALRLITQAAGKTLSLLRFESFDERLPLGQLLGINIQQELRLHDEHIDNVQNMATTDIVELLLQTRFPPERVIDWVDQAILQLHVVDPDTIERFDKLGVHTATDVVYNYERARTAAPDTSPSLDELRNRFARADASLSAPGAIESLVIALERASNMYSIRYWREHTNEVLPRDANQLILPGTVALLRDQPGEAIRLYDEARRTQNRYAPIPFYLGLAQLAAKQYAQASDSFTEAITLNEPSKLPRPDSYYYYLSRGRARLAQAWQPPNNDPTALDAATADLQIATRLIPRGTEGWSLLADAFALLPARRRDALATYQTVIDLDPERVSPLTLQAFRHRAELRAGFINSGSTENGYKDAANELEELSNNGRGEIETLLTLGALRFGLKEWDAAEKAYRYADALASDADDRGMLGVMRVLIRRKQFNEAISALQTLIQRHPNHAACYMHLGQAYLGRAARPDAEAAARTSDLEEAEKALTRATELDPTNLLAHLDLGRTLVRRNKLKEGIDRFRAVLDNAPTEPPGAAFTTPRQAFSCASAWSIKLTALVSQGIVQDSQNDWAAAQEVYRTALNLSAPTFGLSPLEQEEWNTLAARAYYNLGLSLYEREGHFAEAEAHFADALKIDDTFNDAAERQALAILSQAITARGDSATTLYTHLGTYADEQIRQRGADLPYLRLCNAVALLETGHEFARAEADLLAASAAFERQRRRDWLSVALFYLGRVQLQQNQPKQAAQSFESATLGVNFSRTPVALHTVYRWQARALQAAGDLPAARKAAQQAQLFSADADPDEQHEIASLLATMPVPVEASPT